MNSLTVIETQIEKIQMFFFAFLRSSLTQFLPGVVFPVVFLLLLKLPSVFFLCFCKVSLSRFRSGDWDAAGLKQRSRLFGDCRHHEQLLIRDSSPTESFLTRPGAGKGFFFLSPRKIFCHQPLLGFCVFFHNSSHFNFLNSLESLEWLNSS